MKTFTETIIFYFRLWFRLTVNSFSITLTSRLSMFLFLSGKVLRFIFMIVFVMVLFSRTRVLETYNQNQILFFYLTFNLIDTVSQLFFREVYRFRPQVISGDFDLVLVKPMNPLFRALAGGADPLDLIMSLPFIAATIYIGWKINLGFYYTAVYMVLLINGFMIAVGFHILVLALAIITTEIDHTIMIYRDLTGMGKLPVDIYREPIRFIVTFIIPVGIMMTFPAQAFMGRLNPVFGIVSMIFGLLFFTMCIKVWRFSLSKYTSASS